jgi:hypothetical protein
MNVAVVSSPLLALSWAICARKAAMVAASVVGPMTFWSFPGAGDGLDWAMRDRQTRIRIRVFTLPPRRCFHVNPCFHLTPSKQFRCQTASLPPHAVSEPHTRARVVPKQARIPDVLPQDIALFLPRLLHDRQLLHAVHRGLSQQPGARGIHPVEHSFAAVCVAEDRPFGNLCGRELIGRRVYTRATSRRKLIHAPRPVYNTLHGTSHAGIPERASV